MRHGEEQGLGWVGAGRAESWGAVGKWGHPGMVGLATAVLVLRSSLTLGTHLPRLHRDPKILHGRGDAPSEPQNIARWR